MRVLKRYEIIGCGEEEALQKGMDPFEAVNVYTPKYGEEFCQTYPDLHAAILACVKAGQYLNDNPQAIVDFGDGDTLPSVTLVERGEA